MYISFLWSCGRPRARGLQADVVLLCKEQINYEFLSSLASVLLYLHTFAFYLEFAFVFVDPSQGRTNTSQRDNKGMVISSGHVLLFFMHEQQKTVSAFSVLLTGLITDMWDSNPDANSIIVWLHHARDGCLCLQRCLCLCFLFPDNETL